MLYVLTVFDRSIHYDQKSSIALVLGPSVLELIFKSLIFIIEFVKQHCKFNDTVIHDIPGGARKSVHLCCSIGYGDCGGLKFGEELLGEPLGSSLND